MEQGRRCWHLATLTAASLAICAHCFEVFSEQQILTPNNANGVPLFYNNTEYGLVHIDDYWAKIDINYSPLEGYSLFRHVRIGCFQVFFDQARITSFIEWEDPQADAIECVSFCNKTQAYLRKPFCRCAVDEQDIFMHQPDDGLCTEDMWEVFREYDYRSQMSPSTYDVARRVLYQVVGLRVPHVPDPVRYYLHALNVMEAQPKFEYDTQLERMVFNAVWDFGKKRLVALSYKENPNVQVEPLLDFTTVEINVSTAGVTVTQTHTSIQNQIDAQGSLVRDYASCDGLSTVDILWGVYYTVLPAILPESPTVVHTVLAVDILQRRVLDSITIPVALVNMQINAFSHVLYGAGVDYLSRNMYYQLCISENTTEVDIEEGVTRNVIKATCNAEPLGELPAAVQYMYLQSAAMDHIFDYAWFTYKTEPTGRPLVAEYHHDDGDGDATNDLLLWREESLPLEAGYTALIQTAPRIIYALYPPTIRFAKFSSSGTKIFVQFDVPTLRGAIPRDLDGDEIPDIWYDEDKKKRVPCEEILDDFTMKLVPGSMCEWTSDTDFFVEIRMDSLIVPGDLLRIRGGRVYAGRRTAAGVYQFSQPSTDFAIVELPDFIPTPVPNIASPQIMDVCTELVLDGTASYGHGFRGTFIWTLNKTDPATSEPEIRHMVKVLQDMQAEDQSPQIAKVPKNTVQAGTWYYFQLEVVSFFDVDISTTVLRPIYVSEEPVPPFYLPGMNKRQRRVDERISIATVLELEGGCGNQSDASVTYTWAGCRVEQAVPRIWGIVGCPDGWDNETFDAELSGISGIGSKTLLIEPYTLALGGKFMFTVIVDVLLPGKNKTVQNQASVEIEIMMPPIRLRIQGGTGFTSPRNEAIVIDVSESSDPAYPLDYADAAYSFSCEVGDRRIPCPLDGAPGVAPGGRRARRLALGDPVAAIVYYEPASFPIIPCRTITGPGGETLTFSFRGKTYQHAEGITLEPYSDTEKYCMQGVGIIVFQSWAYNIGTYSINTNMTVTKNNMTRSASGAIKLTVVEPNARAPLIALDLTTTVMIQDSIQFEGDVTNKQNETTYRYSYSAFQWGANRLYDVDQATIDPDYDVPKYTYIPLLDSELDFYSWDDVRTSPGSRFLTLVQSILSPGIEYVFRLTVTDEVLEARNDPEASGFAEYSFYSIGLPPSGGKFTVTPNTGIVFETNFELSMMGWSGEELPITYKFGYKADYEDPLEEVAFLSSTYGDVHTMKSPLPLGLVEPGNLLEVYGFAMSSIGAIQTASQIVSVRAPDSTTATPEDATAARRLVELGSLRDKVLDRMIKMEPETALVNAVMAAQSSSAGNMTELTLLFDVVQEKIDVQTMQGKVAGQRTPMTKELIQSLAIFYAVVAERGLKESRVLVDVSGIVRVSTELGFLAVADCFTSSIRKVDIPLSVFSALDSFIPKVTPPTVTGRRLLRYDGRADEDMWLQLEYAREVQRNMSNAMLYSLHIGELPANYTLAGYDYYFGKDSNKPEDANLERGVIRQTFSVPTLVGAGIDKPIDGFVYRYTQFNEFPFGFISLPNNTALEMVAPPDDDKAKRVVETFYRDGARLWHAMTLELADFEGASLEEEVALTLENASANLWPRLAASHLDHNGTIEHPAKCFGLMEQSGSFSSVRYATEGIIFDEDACLTSHLSSFVVLIDNLALDLFFDEYSNEDSPPLEYIDERRTMASVGFLSAVLLFSFMGCGAGLLFDESERKANVKAIDDQKSWVVKPFNPADPDDKFDASEQLSLVIQYTFRRCHLLTGLVIYHRKLTREKRVACLACGYLLTWAICTLFHSKFEFPSEAPWIATGLIAGVVCFPVVQLAMFLYEWVPETKRLAVAPPGSQAAKPIPLKTTGAKVPKLAAPTKPPMPTSHVPPPPPKLQLRVGANNFVPPLPVALPAPPSFPPRPAPKPPPPPSRQLTFSEGDKVVLHSDPTFVRQQLYLTEYRWDDEMLTMLGKSFVILKVPRPGIVGLHPSGRISEKENIYPYYFPVGAVRPAPVAPKGPVPEKHLTAVRDPGAPPALALPPVPPRPAGTPGPFGLAIPELGKLMLQDAKTVLHKTPKPPPRPPNQVPRPPRAPPPPSNMYFSVPKQASVPQVPPMQALGSTTSPPGPPKGGNKAGLPALPSLPRLQRPQNLAQVQLGDSSGAPPPPPPPPPPKGRGGSQLPTAPGSPRTGELPPLTLAKPSAMGLPPLPPLGMLDLPPGATGDSMESPEAPPSPPPSPPPEDHEMALPNMPTLFPDAQHKMAPPTPPKGRGPRPPAGPPPGTGGFRLTAKAAAEAGLQTGLPALPDLPNSVAAADRPGGASLPALPPVPPHQRAASAAAAPFPTIGQALPGPIVPFKAASKASGSSALVPALLSEAHHAGGTVVPFSAAPPPFAPPPPKYGTVATIPALRLTDAGGPPQRMPALPKLPLPSSVLSKVASVAQNPAGVVPPPPPPPLSAFNGKPAPPSASAGQPIMFRKLEPFREPGPSNRLQPKPPARRPPTVRVPKPPAGPPPAHAIVMKARPVAAGSAGLMSAARRKTILPPPAPKAPTDVLLPGFVHKAQTLETVAPKVKKAEEAKTLAVSWHQTRHGQKPRPGTLRRLLWKKPADHYPVPDWIIQASELMCKGFVYCTSFCSIGVILIFGTYMPPALAFATHVATFIGCMINWVVFESLKCLVIACLSLMQEEQRQIQVQRSATNARLAMKGQRQELQIRLNRKVDNVLAVPPPLMG
eukprot:TRINITY_DN80382_c0_g1_i1.p1 TRINITY_DN80382_c0_g1~~TRINITY_DN80382_c0_g1_i1.p1  ORF type:complete len:2724 (-),score=360.62 TRINITY_DN80382_c0_g1_i1:125-8296(-)